MSAAFVAEGQEWPAAEPFDLCVIADDGLPVVFPSIEGTAEVAVRAKHAEDGTTLVMPALFATVDQARRAGVVLAKAFAQVEAIGAETVEACAEHEFEEFLLSRELWRHRICVRCGTYDGKVPMRELAAS